jgi:transcriptional regulator with XRE-family HTH domain
MPTKKSAANQAIAQAIRAVRMEQGLTQEAFALKAGLDRSYYGAIERGEFNLTIDTLLKVTVGLGITAAELFQSAGL